MRREGITHVKTADVEILLGPKPVSVEPVEVPLPEPETPHTPREVTPRRQLPELYSHPSLKTMLGGAHPDNR